MAKPVRIHAHSITAARGDLGSDNVNILKISSTVLSARPNTTQATYKKEKLFEGD